MLPPQSVIQSFLTRALNGAWLYPTVTFVLLLIVWEALIALTGLHELILPKPSSIALYIVQDSYALARHSWFTLYIVILALIIATAAGIILGLLVASSRLLARTLYPLLIASQTMPKIAIAPLLIIWLGFGSESRVALAVTIAFFPIVINTIVGLQSVRQEMLYLFKSMGATKTQIFLKLLVPNALPTIFGGIQVAATLAVIGAIVAEFLSAPAGLGYVVQSSMGNFDTRRAFAGMILLSVMGMLVFGVVGLIERLFIPKQISKATTVLQG